MGEVDGEYHYDHKHSVLEWQLPVIDLSNKSGSMEFSIAGSPGDFFPVSVTFSSPKSYCNLKVQCLFLLQLTPRPHGFNVLVWFPLWLFVRAFYIGFDFSLSWWQEIIDFTRTTKKDLRKLPFFFFFNFKYQRKVICIISSSLIKVPL